MQRSSEHQERGENPRRDEAPEEPGSASTTESAAARSDVPAAGEAALFEPTEVFLLDYDRELIYLREEGRLRRGMRPTGFKQ